jgi:hypothetical protein
VISAPLCMPASTTSVHSGALITRLRMGNSCGIGRVLMGNSDEF